MKKGEEFSRILDLDKTDIADLTAKELNDLQGGGSNYCTNSCDTNGAAATCFLAQKPCEKAQ